MGLKTVMGNSRHGVSYRELPLGGRQ